MFDLGDSASDGTVCLSLGLGWLQAVSLTGDDLGEMDGG